MSHDRYAQWIAYLHVQDEPLHVEDKNKFVFSLHCVGFNLKHILHRYQIPKFFKE